MKTLIFRVFSSWRDDLSPPDGRAGYQEKENLFRGLEVPAVQVLPLASQPG